MLLARLNGGINGDDAAEDTADEAADDAADDDVDEDAAPMLSRPTRAMRDGSRNGAHMVAVDLALRLLLLRTLLLTRP